MRAVADMKTFGKENECVRGKGNSSLELPRA
jgi:hypothetical protein